MKHICYEKNKAIYSVSNTIKKLHIQSDFHFIYKQNFYHDKQDEIDAFFIEYHVTVFDDLDHPALIKERKQNINSAAYEENINKVIKPSSKKKKLIVIISLINVQQELWRVSIGYHF